MTNLNISIGNEGIGIILPSCKVSISVGEKNQKFSEDTVTQLEWSKTLLDGKSVNYSEAEKAAKALGDGWRLPTRNELESLIDLSRHDPAIDTNQYPDTKSSYYWTSTPCAWNDAAVWLVGFGRGGVSSSHRDDGACVRAVRSSQ